MYYSQDNNIEARTKSRTIEFLNPLAPQHSSLWYT